MAEDKASAQSFDSNRKTGRGRNGGTGAFTGAQAGARNDGVSSAKPQVVTGKEDASFETGEGKPGGSAAKE